MKKRPKRGNSLRFRRVDRGAGNEPGDAGGWMRCVKRLKPALKDILASAIALCGADFCSIQLMDLESGDLKIVAQRGFPKWWIEYCDGAAKGKGTRGTALERGRRMIVEDVKRNPAFLGKRAQAMQLKAGVRAVQSTPLATRTGKHLGMFSTHYRRPGGPDERAVRLLDLLARQVSDVIEREQAEEALRQSEERLRLAQQAARSGTFEWNLQTGVNTWSPGLERLYGLRSGEFSRTQLAWEQLVHPDDRPEALRRVEQAFRTGKLTEGEWRVVWPDGSVHWLAGRWQVFKDRAGRPVRMAGVNFDITARKETEAALQRSEALYRAIGESIDYGVWVCAPDGRNTYASESFLKMVGITQAQCSNFGWGSVLHPEDAQRTIAAWKRCVRTGGKWDIEHRFRGAGRPVAPRARAGGAGQERAGENRVLGRHQPGYQPSEASPGVAASERRAVPHHRLQHARPRAGAGPGAALRGGRKPATGLEREGHAWQAGRGFPEEAGCGEADRH